MNPSVWASRTLSYGLLVGAGVGCGPSSDGAGTSRTAHSYSQEAARTKEKPEKKDKKDKRPNILLLVADDMGYSDIGAFGGEIDTPNLDALVGDGRILTNHHSGTVSAIARAMLMSGTDHHLVGMGTMGVPSDERRGLPGYEGYLNERSLSVAELLRDGGYHTYIAGKWHLGMAVPGETVLTGKSPDQWGFEHSYTVLSGGVGNHFAHENPNSKSYSEDGVYVQPGQPNQPGGPGGTPEVFYTTEFFTQKLIQYIDGHLDDGQPFFAFGAYTSPHWPLQVPEPWLGMYKGRYDEGYEPIKAARIERMKALGIIPCDFVPSPGMPETLSQSPAGTKGTKYINALHEADEEVYAKYRAGVITKNWESLTALEKKAQARYMEIYAGMVANLDYNIGLLIQHLKDIGEYDNTFIMFHSDNGAEGWSLGGAGDPKAVDEANAAAGVYETLGTDNGVQSAKMIKYGHRWAEVSAAPMAQFKGGQGEGGLLVPTIVHLPKHFGQHKHVQPLTGFTHIEDEAPTFLDLAGIAPPSAPAPVDLDPATGKDRNAGKVVYKDRYVYPMTGVSLLPYVSDKHNVAGPCRATSFGTESYGRAAIYSQDGQWKARWTEPPFGPMDGHWELFHIATDRAEVFDRAAELPELTADLFLQWQSYMTSVGGVEPAMPFYMFY